MVPNSAKLWYFLFGLCCKQIICLFGFVADGFFSIFVSLLIFFILITIFHFELLFSLGMGDILFSIASRKKGIQFAETLNHIFSL